MQSTDGAIRKRSFTIMNIEKAVYAFRISGQPISCLNFGHGHINSTFKVTTDTGREYILQKINKYVFKDPMKVMSNAAAVTNHIRKQVIDPNTVLHIIPTLRGTYCHRDEEGEFWRMYDFVGGFCLDTPESDEDFYESALAFGAFQRQLADFPAETLYETIPEFHNTVDRYRLLKEAIKADNVGRAAEVQAEINFALGLEAQCSILQQMREAGTIPLRITHNDTKLNNVLLNRRTRKWLCVLDLDTVMPGLSVHDFGDSIRFGAGTAAEDEPDASKMKLDLNKFQVYTRGFLEAATTLTETEIDNLALGALTITMETGIRFLKDYLDGDIYFKTAYLEHNLIRARTQFALAADMKEKWEQMQQIVREVAKEVHSA